MLRKILACRSCRDFARCRRARPDPPLPPGVVGMAAGTVGGTTVGGVARASWSAVPPTMAVTDMATAAAATCARVVPTPWGPRWRLVNRCY